MSSLTTGHNVAKFCLYFRGRNAGIGFVWISLESARPPAFGAQLVPNMSTDIRGH